MPNRVGRCRDALRTCVPELIDAIMNYLGHYDHSPKAFVWTTTADQIMQKAQPALAMLQILALHESGHQASPWAVASGTGFG